MHAEKTRGEQLTAFADSLDAYMAAAVARVLGTEGMHATLVMQSMYLPEMRVNAAVCGVEQKLEVRFCGAMLAITAGIAYERSVGKLELLMSSNKREMLRRHTAMCDAFEQKFGEECTGPKARKFMERFGELLG